MYKILLISLIIPFTLKSQSVKVGLSTEIYFSPLQSLFESRLSDIGFGDEWVSPFNSSTTSYPVSIKNPSFIFNFDRHIDKKNSFGFHTGVISRGMTEGYAAKQNLFLSVRYYAFLFDLSFKRILGKHSVEISPGFINFAQFYRDRSLKTVSRVRMITSLSYQYELIKKNNFSISPYFTVRLIQKTDLGPFRLAKVSDEFLFENKQITQLAFGFKVELKIHD